MSLKNTNAIYIFFVSSVLLFDIVDYAQLEKRFNEKTIPIVVGNKHFFPCYKLKYNELLCIEQNINYCKNSDSKFKLSWSKTDINNFSDQDLLHPNTRNTHYSQDDVRTVR